MEWRIYALPDGIFPQGFSFGVFCGVALSETEFYAFAEKALALQEVKSLLMSAVNAHNATGQKGKG